MIEIRLKYVYPPPTPIIFNLVSFHPILLLLGNVRKPSSHTPSSLKKRNEGGYKWKLAPISNLELKKKDYDTLNSKDDNI